MEFTKKEIKKQLVLDANDLSLKPKIAICKYVGEGSESCGCFKAPMWCLNTIKNWRKC